MIIKRLELQGFKSFPERTKVVFHPGITAIVGPNGTGKSNLVDAILWVLGGQRSKGLRGDKTEHIIFNGNTKKPPLGMAEVSLFLEHGEEEISITHRVFRTGEGEYRLNGKAARLKDIQDALWKRAVAEKDYFVIEQGNIGLILTAKPNEKRLFLEEAAGTAFYKDKKKEAESKLALSEQNLLRLEDIISEVSRAKNSLQRQAQAASRYRKLREKCRELMALNFRRKLTELERRHEEVDRSHGRCLLEEREIVSRIKDEERGLAEKRRKLWELEKNIKENRDALHALESQVQRTEAEIEREKRRKELLAEKMENVARAALEFEEETGRLENEIVSLQNELTEFEKAQQEKASEIARVESASATRQGDSHRLEDALTTLKEEHLRKLSALTELKNEALKTEKELDLLVRQQSKLLSRLREEEILLESKRKALTELEDDQTKDHSELEERGKKLASFQESLASKKVHHSDLRHRKEEVKRKMEEDYHKLQALRRIETPKALSDDEEELRGMLGRLADLIEADSEVAELVDSFWKEEVVSPVIPVADFLRQAAEKRLRGRFLLVRPSGEEKRLVPPEHPRVLGTFKSRLRPHPKIKDYFGQFKEAVIVQDIQTAVELWSRFPEWSYLTPAGDVLLSSGLLKLGKKEEGMFSLGKEIRELEERIRRSEEELSPLDQEFEATLAELASLEDRIASETAFQEELRRNLQSREKTIIALTTELERNSASRRLLERELEAIHQDSEALARQRDLQIERIQQLDKEEQALKKRMGEIEEELVLQRGGNIEQEKHLIELRAAEQLLQEKIRHATLKLNELTAKRENLKSRVKVAREEIEAASRQLLDTEGTLQALETKAKNLAAEIEKRQTELHEQEIILGQLREAEEEGETKLAGFRETLEKKKEERVRFEVNKAEIERDLVNLEEVCWQELKKNLDELRKEPVPAEFENADIEDMLSRTEEELQKFKAVNLMAEEEYVRHKERYEFLVQQRNDLRQSIADTLQAIRQIDEESKNQFLEALASVNAHFQEVFALLFRGGTASVRLVDETNPFESGVEIIAQPPGKKVQNISLLSGGEKSLAGLAFLFALFRYKPTPFCILDEVDAALDDANLSRFLELMKNLKKETQFIIITHNYKTMEVADFIYGTTMAEPNITRLYSVKLEKQQELIP